MTFRGGISQKTDKEEGLPKKGGFGQFADLRGEGGRLVKKEGVVFFEGGGDTPIHTMLLDQLKGEGRPFLEGPKKGTAL